ncbi:helix-turn-helix transcriptional regulator [Phenylobacterium sp.]|uniref:helix-turn-helix transcriptional regulator n=1 Tax=Phenylobacterium sp. TaxID=1871053 RepID=UPI0035B39560
MKPFQWGRFSDFVDAGLVDDAHVSVVCGRAAEFASMCWEDGAGEGAIEYLYTPDLRVIVADFAIAEAKTYEIVDGELVRFHFGLDVSIETSLDGVALSAMNDNPAGLLKAPTGRQLVETIPSGRRQTFVTIGCRLGWVEELFGGALEERGKSIIRLAADVDLHHSLNLRPTLRKAVLEMFARRPRGALRAALVAAKSQEMIALALNDMFGPDEEAAAPIRLTSRDVAAVHAARQILEETFARPLTIRALGLRVGINRTKLFYGFKQLYGMGVAEFLNDLRMEHGLRLLQDTDMPISDIAAELGYEHQCNFSTRFRARHGCSPSAFRARRLASA